jgi:hypothetical protein
VSPIPRQVAGAQPRRTVEDPPTAPIFKDGKIAGSIVVGRNPSGFAVNVPSGYLVGPIADPVGPLTRPTSGAW